MTIRIGTLLGLLFAALTLTAQEPEPPSKAKIYKTPQAVFDAFWGSVKKGDFKVAVEALTPEAQKETAIDLAYQGLRERDGNADPFVKDKGKADPERMKRFKPVFDVLDKYGLTEKATKDIPREGFGRGTKKARGELEKLVKKPEPFAQELLKAMNKADPKKMGGDNMPAPKLGDVKIDGNKAKGDLVFTFEFKDKDGGKRESRQPIEFAKVNGGWRIDPNAGRRNFDDDAPKDKIKDGGFKDKK